MDDRTGPAVGRRLAAHLSEFSGVVSHFARKTPDAAAMVFGERRFNYAGLEELVERCADAMATAGVRPGDRVATLSTPRPEFLVTLLAALRVGGIWVGLNPRYTAREIGYILGNCRPALFLALLEYLPEETLKSAGMPDRIVGLGDATDPSVESFDSFLDSGTASKRRPEVSVSRRDPALLVYTSGTTGRPKGAVLPHASFFHCYRAVLESFIGKEALRANSRMICNLPVNHIGCISEICGNTLLDGGTLVFMEKFDPARMPEVIENERVTIIGGVPAMLQILFEHPAMRGRDFSSLRVITWGGAALPRHLAEALAAMNLHLFTNYGLTEGGSVNTATAPDADLAELTETVGRPDHDHDYRIVTADGDPVRVGESGEIQIRGEGVMLEYFNNPSATAAAFTKDGFLKTGDLAELLPDGRWRLVGRLSEMFKSGGYNVYPREVEAVLEAHPDVALAAVIGVPDRLFDEVGVAFVLPAPDAAPLEDELKAHCRRHLANYKIPKRFHVRRDLPLLPIGKLDKKALKASALEQDGS